MKISSIKQGFSCNHSSVNYQFVSEEKISDDIKDILKSSGRKYRVRLGTIKMQVMGEGYISDALQDALLSKMPLLIYEDYDWWNFLLMFDYDENMFKNLQKFESDGDYSVSVSKEGERIQLWMCAHLDYAELADLNERDPDAALRDIFLEVRRSIMAGDFECVEMISMYCKDRSEYNRYNPHSRLAAKLKPLLDTHVL